jgi:hypothetical protein
MRTLAPHGFADLRYVAGVIQDEFAGDRADQERIHDPVGFTDYTLPDDAPITACTDVGNPWPAFIQVFR